MGIYLLRNITNSVTINSGSIPLNNSLLKGGKMKIKTIMSQNLYTVDPGSTVKDAAGLMSKLRIGAVIVGTSQQIHGILSERDIMNKVVAEGLLPEKTRVKDIMTKNVITIEQTQNTELALRIMEDKAIRHLPVVDNMGNCLGMLGIRDIMRSMVESLESENEALAQYLMADGPGG